MKARGRKRDRRIDIVTFLAQIKLSERREISSSVGHKNTAINAVTVRTSLILNYCERDRYLCVLNRRVDYRFRRAAGETLQYDRRRGNRNLVHQSKHVGGIVPIITVRWNPKRNGMRRTNKHAKRTRNENARREMTTIVRASLT